MCLGARVHSHINLKPSGKVKPVAVREIKAGQIGQLITLRGMVVRATDVVRTLDGPSQAIASSRLNFERSG